MIAPTYHMSNFNPASSVHEWRCLLTWLLETVLTSMTERCVSSNRQTRAKRAGPLNNSAVQVPQREIQSPEPYSYLVRRAY